MMLHVQLGKARRGPPQHVSFNLIHRVGPRTYPQSVDGLPTCSPVSFHASANVKDRVLFKNHLLVFIVVKNSSTDAYVRILLKSLEHPFKIIWLERKVAVELAHKIPIMACQLPKTVIERLDNPCAPLAETTVFA